MGRSGESGVRAQARRRQLLGGPGLVQQLRAYRTAPLPRLVDRKLELLERAALEAAVEQAPRIARDRSRLAGTIARFRPRWKGRRVGRAWIDERLRAAPEREERERAYRAEEPLYRPMESALRGLARARNERARAVGFRSFPEYLLSFDGLTVSAFQGLLDRAVRCVAGEMRRRRDLFQDRTRERGWYPWDVRFSEELEQGLPGGAFPPGSMLRTVLEGVRAWGFPPEALRFRVDRHDLPFGGLCLAIDTPRDVRVVIHPVGGWEYYLGLFHEVGHAAHARSIRQPGHLLRWPEHIPGMASFGEGIGGFFEQIASAEPWLRGRPGLSSATVRAALPTLRRGPLAAMGRLAVWAAQELSLYRRPDGDPAAAGLRIARALYGYDAYRPLSFADSFSIESPLYSEHYVLAELIRSQLTRAVLEEVGGALWPNPRVGPWLIDRWFRDGSSYTWGERLRAVTGRPLGATAFNAEMRAAGA
jgi:hypothetical protein